LKLLDSPAHQMLGKVKIHLSAYISATDRSRRVYFIQRINAAFCTVRVVLVFEARFQRTISET